MDVARRILMALIVAAAIAALIVAVFWLRSRKNRRVFDQHTITPEGLHALVGSKQDVLLFDVRQPLDMLTDSEIIPGAKRVAPHEIIENPSLIPREADSVVYCTCVSEKPAGIFCTRPSP
jgi:hypothetical protein